MTDYFILHPEVPGEFGDGTILDTSTHPPIVSRLELLFSGWLGDELVESFPCHLITQTLGQAALDAGLSGIDLRHATVRADEQEAELGESQTLPPFKWLVATGTPGADDFGLTPRAELVVSERALTLLRTGNLDNCEIEPYVLQ